MAKKNKTEETDTAGMNLPAFEEVDALPEPSLRNSKWRVTVNSIPTGKTVKFSFDAKFTAAGAATSIRKAFPEEVEAEKLILRTRIHGETSELYVQKAK